MKKVMKIRSQNMSKNLSVFVNNIKKKYDDFFDFKILEPLLFVVPSRKDLDLLIGRKTEKWFVGAMKYGNIYILDKKIFARESNHKQKDFWQVLKHEYCHVYYTQITKSHYPVWLNEGLAGYLSGKKLDFKDIDNKFFKIFSYFDKCDHDTYEIGQFWVEKLIKGYGKKKIVKLIKSLNVEERLTNKIFADKFYKIYKFSFNKKNLNKIVL